MVQFMVLPEQRALEGHQQSTWVQSALATVNAIQNSPWSMSWQAWYKVANDNTVKKITDQTCNSVTSLNTQDLESRKVLQSNSIYSEWGEIFIQKEPACICMQLLEWKTFTILPSDGFNGKMFTASLELLKHITRTSITRCVHYWVMPILTRAAAIRHYACFPLVLDYNWHSCHCCLLSTYS